MTADVAETLASYIWHPMPDGLRRKSVTERRASLAAARHRSHEPAEQEQPQDYPTEQEQPQEYQAQTEQPQDYPTEQEQPQDYPTEQEYPVEEEAHAHAQVYPTKEKKSEEQPAEEPPQVASRVAEVAPPTTTGTKRRSKTKHTVLFHGPKWGNVLKSKRREIEQAFRADVRQGTGLEGSRLENLDFTFKDVLSATFTVRNTGEADETQALHAKLQDWKFPATTALYPRRQ